MEKRPTINDVAEHAGVSKSTVSLVLQNSPLVKKKTRDKIDRGFNQGFELRLQPGSRKIKRIRN